MAKKLDEMIQGELEELPHKTGDRATRIEKKKKYKSKKQKESVEEAEDFSVAGNYEEKKEEEISTDDRLTTKNVKEVAGGNIKKNKPNVERAIEDRDFAHGLMKREMDKLEGRGRGKAVNNKEFAQELVAHKMNEELKKENAIFEKEIAKDIEKFKKGLVSIFDKFRDKFSEFRKNITDPEEGKIFADKLEGVINNYAKKIHKFDVIENYDVKTLGEINQLHHELQEWADKDWVAMYKRKNGLGEFIAKDEESVLQNLDDADLHGKHSPVIENMHELETMAKVAALEKKHGKVGTNYIRYKSGFPADSFTIVRYEIGEDEANSFIVIDRLKGDIKMDENDSEGENMEIKISLKEFKKYKVGYRKEIENVGDNNKETGGIIAELSKEEKEELEKLVQEKTLEIDSLLSNSEEIFNGIKKELSEDDFREIEKRIISCKIGLNNIKNLIAKDSEIYKDTRVLDIMNNLEEKVKRLSSDVDKLEKIQHEKNIAFNEIQKEKIKIVTELFKKKKYIEFLETANWDGYRKEDKINAIELITKSQLRLILSTMKDIFGSTETIEKAVGEIFTILNENKSHLSGEK